jgi:hypothetical protein
MDNVVTQEVFKRIDALAEKMGTTAQYLWPKLVAYTQGVAIGQAIISIIVAVALVVTLIWSVKRGIKEDWGPLEFIVSVGCGIFLLFSVGFSISEGPRVFAAILSPEAAAFYKLVGK